MADIIRTTPEKSIVPLDTISEFTADIDLSKTLVTPDMLPEIAHDEGSTPVIAEIISPTEVKLGDTVVDVSTPLLVLNSLLLHRDHKATSAELKDIGFNLHRTHFVRHIGMIASRFKDASGQDLLITEGYGKGMTYQLSPALQLRDGRRAGEGVLDGDLTRFVKSKPMDFEQFDGSKCIQFNNPQVRKSVFSAIIRKYNSHPSIREELRNIYDELGDDLYSSRGKMRLSEDEVTAHVFKIEKGLIAAVYDNKTPESEAAVMDLVRSYHQLYHRHLYLIHIVSREMAAYEPKLYNDLFQEGSIGLIKAIMNFTLKPEDNATGTLGSAAYSAIKGEIKHYKATCLNVVHVPKNVLELRQQIARASAALTQILQRTPTLQDVAEHLDTSVQKIQDASVDVTPYELIALDDGNSKYDFDREYDAYAIEQDIHELFTNPQLTDREKIVMSLRAGIFVPALRGAEFVARGKTTFIYPYEADDLMQISGEFKKVAEAIGLTAMAALYIERGALRKSRAILLETGTDEYIL